MVRPKDSAELCGIDAYYCDRQLPWQRPTDESGNGFLRRYVGKGTDLPRNSAADLRKNNHRFDAVPLRSLRWPRPHDVYPAAIAKTGRDRRANCSLPRK